MFAATRGLVEGRAQFLWPWLLVSIVIHLMVVLFGVAGAGLMPGRGVDWGRGYGGTSIAIEIAGARDEAPVGAAPALSPPSAPPIEESNAIPLPAEEPAEEPAEPAAEPETADAPDGVVVPSRSPSRRRQAEPEPAAPPQASETPALPGAETGALGESEETGGTGADDSTAGAQAGDPSRLILGSAGFGGDAVTTRQALLANGGVCTDPAAGTWRAQRYDPGSRRWIRFTVHLRRAGDRLTGTILNRSWTGNPSNPAPGPCTAFGSDNTYRMPARASLDGEHLRVIGGPARLVSEDCPSSLGRYYPDRFEGTLHALRDVFEAVNNDGAVEVDQPYTFRRISCD